jgi:peptide/nickel transport system substrate-binding protein
MKIFLKILFYIGLFALLGFLSTQLFFLDEYNKLKEQIFHTAAIEEESCSDELLIAYAFGPDNLEPTSFNSTTRSRILNVYEGLMRTDRNLQIEPSLALSWGRLEDDLWEIKLRPNVFFHDGSSFDADDVIASFDRAMKNKESELKDLLSTIKSVEKIDDLKVRITTKEPDPILTNRIINVLMFPSEKKDFKIPVGTGPYQHISYIDKEMKLKRHEDYWGDVPHYGFVTMKTIPNRFDRLDALKNGQIHVLANVPPSFAEELEQYQTISIVSFPSLEVNFLIFNMESELLKDQRIRTAISFAFDKNAFVDFSKGYAQPSNQFVSNGVFGFNPDIKSKIQDTELAKTLVREYDPFKRPSIIVDMTEGTEVVGQYIKDQLNEIGISVQINILPWEELREKIFNKESEMYYLGWRSEIGDASSFYENVIHSEGRFNGGNYSSKKVDQLIDLSLVNFDQKKRSTQLHEIMKILIEEDIMGIPLFESDAIYGICIGVQFKPRLDGYILASEIF